MADEVRETLRQWIAADDELRGLQAQMKTLRDRKTQLSSQVLEFMRGNNLDNFVIEGGIGTIARQQRTTRSRPPKQVVRAQIAMLLSDQPERMAEVLRTMEGVPNPGEEPDTASTVVREVLTRRLPRTQHLNLG
jgi:hypothetical protein